jgi:hypothetical protein
MSGNSPLARLKTGGLRRTIHHPRENGGLEKQYSHLSSRFRLAPE